MASQTIPFAKTKYYGLHPYVDNIFIRRHLIPELKKQGLLGLSSRGVELPGTGEFISLEEAKGLVFDYLVNVANLGERDQKALGRVIGYQNFANLADGYLNREVSQPQALGAAIDPTSVEKVVPTDIPTSFSAEKRIKQYNDLYQKVLREAYLGDASKILARLFPGNISTTSGVSEYALAQIIAANITRLQSAGQLSTEGAERNYKISRELSDILGQSPTRVGYRNFLGNQAIQATLAQYVDSIAASSDLTSDENRRNFDEAQKAYGQSLKQILPNESELRSRIYNALPLVRDNERLQLADQILRASTSGSLDGITLDEILENLKIDPDLRGRILHSLEKTDIALALDLQQNNLRFLADTHTLTAGEHRLIKKGINPFLTTQNQNLITKDGEVLREYNERSGQSRQFATLDEAYKHELSRANPDVLFLSRARDILNRERYFASLSSRERATVGRTRIGRWAQNTSSRIHHIQDKLTDTVFDLTDTITGKKWLYQQWDKWDEFAAKLTIPGTKIPLFRLNTWMSNQWQSWKKTRVTELIKASAQWTSPLGKWTHRRAKDYKLGGSTFKGMVFVGFHRTWSNIAYKASGKVIKNGLIFSERTARRLLIKIGGKALAKTGMKAITYLIDAASVVGIVLIAKDVLEFIFGAFKWVWEKLKSVLHSPEGATAVIITALSTAWLVGTGFVLGLLKPLILPAVVTIAMVFGIAFGSVFFFSSAESAARWASQIDPGTGYQQFVASIVCDSQGDSNNPASAAVCIADYLIGCKLSPLHGTMIGGAGWKCLLAQTALTKEAIAAIELSAPVDNNFQCVGMAAAYVGQAFHMYFPQINAKDYANNAPSGFKWVSGCKDGALFVDTGGAFGHIGVVVKCGPANIVCVDANYAGPGVTRNQDTCRYDTSKIAGYLVKM